MATLQDVLKENKELQKKQNTTTVAPIGNPASPYNKAVQTGNPNVQAGRQKISVTPTAQKQTYSTPLQAQTAASKKAVDLLGNAIGSGVSQTLSGISNLAKSVPVTAEMGAKAISNLADAPVSPMTSKLTASEIKPKEDNFVKNFTNALFGSEKEVQTVELPKTEQDVTKNQFRNIANKELIAQGEQPVKQITEWTDPWNNALEQNVENAQDFGQRYTQAVKPVTDFLDNASQTVDTYLNENVAPNLSSTEQFVTQAVGNAIPNFARQTLLGAVSGGSVPLLSTLSDVAMFLPSFYQGYEEGKQRGLSDEEAYFNAILRGGIEAGSEHLSDVWMVNGGQSQFDEWLLNKIALSGMNPFAKFVGKNMVSGIGESMEEVAARLGNTLTDRAIYGDNIDVGQLALGSLEDAGASFISTMVLGLLGGQYTNNAYRQYQNDVNRIQNENSIQEQLNSDANKYKTEIALVYANMTDEQKAQYLAQAQQQIAQKDPSDPVANMDIEELKDWVDRNAEKQIMGLTEEQYAKFIDRMNGAENPIAQTSLPNGQTFDVYEYLGTRTADQERAIDLGNRMGKNIIIADELPMGQNALTLGDGTVIISSNAQRPATALAFHEMFHSLKDNGQWEDLMGFAYETMTKEKGYENFLEDLVSRYVGYYGNIDNNYLNSIASSVDLTNEQKRQEVKDYLREQGVNQYYTDANFRSMIDEEVAADFMERFNNEDTIKAMYNRSGNMAEQMWQKLIDAVESFTGMLTQDEENLRRTEQMFADVARQNYEEAKNDIGFADDGSVYPKYSATTWNALGDIGKRQIAEEVAKQTNTEIGVAMKWIDDINSVAAIIGANKDRLDYTPNNAYTALKNDQDYIYTIDMSTLCKKRILLSNTIDEIQKMLPNVTLTGDDYIRIRQMMKDKGYEVACGFCYVESRRKFLDTVAQQFIDAVSGNPTVTNKRQLAVSSELKNKDPYIPTLYDLTTANGSNALMNEHPNVYSAFVDFNNARGQNRVKLIETRTEYNGEIMKISEGQIKKLLRQGGLRLQSYSDFETPHLIDMMQVVADMSRRGLTSQAYTKVPNFADAFGETGIKINESLVVTGVDENGELIYDDVEGMPHEIAFALRQKHSENVGTIVVGKDDETILAAMADPKIDFIIPFHKSGWKNEEYANLGIAGYKDYTNYQNERDVVSGKADVGNFYPMDYWDFSVSGDENAKTYLRMCEEQGRIPKFDNFLTKDREGHWVAPSGYWKTLIDFKMYDNDGVGVPQRVVTPTFDDAVNQRILDEYEGDHNKYSPKMDIVNEFIREKGYDTRYSIDDTYYKDLRFDTVADRDAFAAQHPTYLTASELAELEEEGDWDLFDEREADRDTALRDFTKYETPRLRRTKVRELFEHPERFSHRDLDRFYDAFTPNSLLDFYDDPESVPVEDIVADAIEAFRDGGYADDWEDFLDSEFLARLAPGATEEEVDTLINEPINARRNQSEEDVPTDDASYMAAVMNGDTELAQQMVDARAREQGYNTPHLYHGTPTGGFTEFDPRRNDRQRLGEGMYFTDREDVARNYLRDRGTGDYNPMLYDVYLNMGENPYEVDLNNERASSVGMNNSTGNIIRNIRDGSPLLSSVYVARNPNQIKSAEAVTYDDEGNVIPLSERFNPESNDIRYSLDAVEPIQPTSNAWRRDHTTDEVKAMYPDLWDVSAEESETRNPTQVKSTISSYRKIYDFLQRNGFNGTILDASSGLGYGTELGRTDFSYDVDDIEPYPGKGYSPRYTDYSSLNKTYDAIISNAVLNVLPQDQRDALVVKMGQMLNPGGQMFVNVRGDDVMNASSKKIIDPDNMEVYISNTGSYQKGFKPSELKSYLEDALGEGYTVQPTKMFGKVAAIVTKNPEARYSLEDGTLESAVYIKDGVREDGSTVSFVDDILDRRKLGETRKKRNLPTGWQGLTRGGKGAVVEGRAFFGEPKEITKESPEYASAMIEGTEYDIPDGGSKWYYPILDVEDFRDNPKPVLRNSPGRAKYSVEDIPEQANAFAVRNVPQNRSAMNFLGRMSRERVSADPLTYESISPESFPVPDRIQDYIDLINDEEDRKYGFDAPIENELTDEDKDFYQGLSANRTGALQGFATPTQTFNAIAKGEQREELRDRFERPMYETKKEYNANREQRWNALENMIKETGIQANTPESAAVQWYGEGVKPNEQGETIPYTLDDLKREFPNKWQDIQKMERFMRQMYDEYVGRINAALEQVYPNLEEKAQAQLQSWRNKKQIYQDEISMSRNPSANEYWQNEINKLDRKIAKLEGDLESGEYFRNKRLNPRKDYFHHFQEVETSGLGGLKNILQASTLIDPELVGKTEFTKPKSKWMSWLQKRGEGAYTADAVLGMGKYIDSAEYAIAFDPLIAQYRDEISKMVRATRETKNANQLIQYLSAYTNQLAGKTASLDRTILDLLGEGNRGQLFNVLAAINNRAKSNAVVGNVRSAVAQIFNIPNALGIIKSNNAWLKGANDYINAKLGNRELLDQSPFLQERYFSHNVDDLKARNTNWEKIIGKAGDITNKMMEFGDREATELIWLAAYNEGLEKNVSDPVYYADDLTRRSVAGRGIGEVPYNMKSKVASFFMPFQTETNNAWQELKQNLRDKDANGIFRLMLGSYILNGFAKLLFNDGVVPDVLGALIDGIKKLFDKDREESVGEVALNTGRRMAGEAVSYIPGTSLWLPAIMSDESAEALFGDSDPTRYGTGTVGLSTITKTLADAVDGGDFDLVTPLLQMGLPYGGRQASRLYNTLQDFNVLPSNGVMNTPIGGERNPVAGDYTQAGALKYRLPEEVNSFSDAMEIARALAFGSNSTNAASEYYDTLKPVLSKERVAKLREHPEVNPDTYIDYLNEASTDGKQGITQQEAYDWLSSHNLSDEERNALWEMTSSSWKKSYDEYVPKANEDTQKKEEESKPSEEPKEQNKKSGNPTTKKEFTAVADSDGNGSLKQAEAYAWLNDQKLSDAEKAALWELMGWKTDYATYASKH